LEKTGMTSGQVLAATTSSAAHLLGYDGLGVIETGRRADLVHAEGDACDLNALAGNIAEVRKDGERVVVRQERHEKPSSHVMVQR
jgi:imidazolonepropionase-like amidohydrolase